MPTVLSKHLTVTQILKRRDEYPMISHSLHSMLQIRNQQGVCLVAALIFSGKFVGTLWYKLINDRMCPNQDKNANHQPAKTYVRPGTWDMRGLCENKKE
jgi:hypothetical protein